MNVVEAVALIAFWIAAFVVFVPLALGFAFWIIGAMFRLGWRYAKWCAS